MPSPERVAAACPDLDPAVVEGFLSRMDPDYLSLFGPEEIARHIRLSTQLDDERPARVEIVERGELRFDVVVVGFDYFSELSILCGLLASFGLDIESGNIYTFGPAEVPRLAGGPRRPPRVSPKKIVDVFRVRALSGPGRFTPEDAAHLPHEALQLVHLLGEGRYDDARDRVNRRLAEHLGQVRARFGGVLLPVEVRFDNARDARWTVLDVHARDTPAFLYAVTDALAARGVYVHKVRIESRGRDVRDRFFVSQRRGGKIEAAAEQDALRLAIVLVKQFTHVLPGAPDPALAIRHFHQLLDTLMECGSEVPPLLGEEESLRDLARILGSSDFLWEDFLRMQFESLMPVLGELRTRGLRDPASLERALARLVGAAGSHDDARRALNRFKDAEMFFIDMKHLLDPAVGIETFSEALTDLAEAVLRGALRACEIEQSRRHGRRRPGHPPPRFAICGLGKFGGREMGYASDVELLFVEDGSGGLEDGTPSDEYHRGLADDVVRFIEAREEGIFRIDLRLRPYGRSGPVVSSIESLRSYYRAGGGAEPFERQALVKLRTVAGDASLGREVEQLRDRFTYGSEPWDLDRAVHLRGRQVRELVKTGEVNLKYSPGGLIDVEYAVQYLQILHGAARPELRMPSTLAALARLRDAALVDPAEHDVLRAGYLSLRQAIEALRMVRGAAGDLILPGADTEDLKFLARRLGYSGLDWTEAARRFRHELAGHMAAVADFYDRRFGRRRPEAIKP